MDAIAAEPEQDDIDAVVETIAGHEDEYVSQDDIEHRMQQKGYSDAETLFLLIQADGKNRVERKPVMHSEGELDSGIYYSINTF